MVREANERDLDALLELYLFLHDKKKPEHDEHLKKTWDRMLADENHHVIVNEIDGKPVSSCICVVIPNISRGVRPFALVEYMVTHADYRGKGYASDCLEYARQIAEKENCYKIMLMTGAKDEATLRFYENAGYSSKGKTAFNQMLGEEM